MIVLPTSLVDILHYRATEQPDKLALRFLEDGEDEEVSITYKVLDERARTIGAILQASTKVGERALILLPAGLDFVAAYLGCLYAKVIAVPVPPPHPARLEATLAATLRIAGDAKPAVALVSSSLFEAIALQKQVKEQFRGIELLVAAADGITDDGEKWQQPEIEDNDLAFLQYTSGSTSLPKGVMVSHQNLLHNLGLIEASFGQSSASETVIWLPPYHDMGLIGGILQPLYTGNPVTLIPHLMFLQRPVRWLQAITRYQATTSGGPNFAYDLCIRKIRPAQREQLDLSTWEVAFNGAEPVCNRTLERFADFFAPCGFRREAFVPCYGLAEATLLVTGGPKARRPVMKNLEKAGLEHNMAIVSPETSSGMQTVVSCGQNLGRQTIRIVDAETLRPCLPGRVGEIWVCGPSIASGYWNKPVETASSFGARLPGSEEGPFLRTGDLGFQLDGELYITGRLKNLIIIDGKNYDAQDIERTVEACHPGIKPSGCAVFAIENAGREQVIVMAEMQVKLVTDTAEVIKAIRNAVAQQHELPVCDIRLVFPGSIPKTTSGKTRHFVCKKNYLSGTLNEIIPA
ncbi:AMP-binding protein [Pontibacter diazotrophicus]|uniref:AMP-binding protein n=1 Tax=Pontibacter diazotrophicus TaxID=1400979 RepID=A0A3D8LD47_9BACT|nr:fatty acyl-AMP ligase [Pontibacter diazotrophicus]RDV15369.1 AMP-binding protein [Pontibacter diazotrophicus]